MPVGVNRGKAPLIAYGAFEDLSTWQTVGTPVITTGQADPFGGTDAYLLDDNDGAAAEIVFETFVVATALDQPVAVFLREGTAAVTDVDFRDQTATTLRHTVRITCATGIVTTVSGAGVIIQPIALGGGWFLLLFTANSIVAGNTHAVRIHPAGTTASNTGTVTAYVRSVLVMGEALDNANAWTQPREGSRFSQGADGTEDAWIIGDDHKLKGVVRWIPPTFQQNPRTASGWDGRAPFAGVDTGWNAFLTDWARDKQTFLWTPDRSVSTLNIDSYLESPMKGAPPLEDDFTRRLDLMLRSSDGLIYEGY